MNKTILITAGPTYEKIDPVRFIGNFSSGKMGFELAQTFAERGAKVIMICGPVNLKIDHQNITRIDVVSANDMYQACKKHFNKCNIAIMAAAVADYTSQQLSTDKIKSDNKEKTLQLYLTPTKDIAKELGEVKKRDQILVGFALETNNEEANAIQKIQSKNLDFIVLNSLKDAGAGFGYDTNKVSFIHPGNKKKTFELKSKKEVANDIADEIMLILNKQVQ